MGRYLGSKRRKTRRYVRDPDQILHDDLATSKSVTNLKHQAFDETKPGLAQHYCLPCARYCESEYALQTHQKSKVHKRRLRELKFGPYTKEEAEFAAGRDVAKFMAKSQLQRDIKADADVQELLTPIKPKDVKEETMIIEADESAEPNETETTTEAQNLLAADAVIEV